MNTVGYIPKASGYIPNAGGYLPKASACSSVGEFLEVLKLARWAFTVSLILPTIAMAQPKPGVGPSSTHIFPAGGQRGTTVAVAVGGECLPPGTRFVVSNPAVQVHTVRLQEREPDVGEASQRRYPTETPINYPKQWSSQLTISDNADLGPFYWRLSCAVGGTCSRPFLVGDLPEFIESESNSSPDRGEHVELPLTINGQISGERDVDYYRFKASAGDVVSCEVIARRLGSPLDANVTFHDAGGRKLNSERRYLGSDAILAVAIDKTGDYLLRIANVSFRGDPSLVYRLNLSRRPYVYSCFPAGGQPGTIRTVSFRAMSGTGQPVVTNRAVTFPKGVNGHFTYRSTWLANDVVFELTSGVNATETSLTDSVVANRVALPITIDGAFDNPSDVDEYSFEAVAGEWISLQARNRPFRSNAMPVLAVVDANGKELASATCADPDADCRIEWQAPEDGTYRIRLRDLRMGSQGGTDYVYRLSIDRSVPDFSLMVDHDCLNLVADSESLLEVSVQRLGGFAGEIELRIDGLPEGVVVSDALIATGKNATKLKLAAANGVTLGDAILQIVGVATIDGEVVERTLRAKHIGADSSGNCLGPRTLDQLTLTINHKRPFRLFCSEAYQYAHRGSVFMYPMEVERMNGFTGPITLQIGDRQNRDLDGIEMFEVTIPGDSNKIQLPIHLPESMHINIQSQSQLYAQGYATFRDQHDRLQAALILAEKRNMLRTLPPVVKLHAHLAQLALDPGETAEVNLFLERTKNFDGPMQLALVGKAPPGLTIGQAEISGGETKAVLSVKAAADWRTETPSKLRFRAIGWMGKLSLFLKPRSRSNHDRWSPSAEKWKPSVLGRSETCTAVRQAASSLSRSSRSWSFRWCSPHSRERLANAWELPTAP